MLRPKEIPEKILEKFILRRAYELCEMDLIQPHCCVKLIRAFTSTSIPWQSKSKTLNWITEELRTYQWYERRLPDRKKLKDLTLFLRKKCDVDLLYSKYIEWWSHQNLKPLFKVKQEVVFDNSNGSHLGIAKDKIPFIIKQVDLRNGQYIMYYHYSYKSLSYSEIRVGFEHNHLIKNYIHESDNR